MIRHRINDALAASRQRDTGAADAAATGGAILATAAPGTQPLVRLIPRPYWLAVTGALVLAAAAVCWAWIGTVSDVTKGVGVLLPEQGLTQISSSATGVLRRLFVQQGSDVHFEQQIALIEVGEDHLVPVTSYVEGRVIEVLAANGDTVGQLSPLVRIQGRDQRNRGRFVARCFVPVEHGQKIHSGAPLNVAADNAPSSQYGMIRGVVRTVSAMPASAQRLDFLAGRSDAIASILRSQGPVVELEVDLSRADTPSGYRWTFGDGPDFPIPAGAILRPNIPLNDRTIISRMFE